MKKKSCIKCLYVKNLSEFHNHPKGKDGKRRTCKDCTREINAKFQAKSKANNIKAAKQRAEFREEDKKKVTRKKDNAKYKRNNKEKVKTQSELYKKENKEKISLQKAAYYQKKKAEVSAINLIKKIMSVAVNPKYTQFYYMPKRPTLGFKAS